MSRRPLKTFARIACTLLCLAALFSGCSSKSPGGTPPGPDAGTPADTTPPTFAGARAATGIGETEANVRWDAATDDQSAPAQIAYRIYASDTSTFDFTQPTLVTPAGATSAVVSGLSAGREHSFVVRAVDAAGNEDDNTVVVKTTTTDTSPPTFGGVDSVTATGTTTLHVEWTAATDNATPSSKIVYEIFVSTVQGSHDYSSPTLTTAAGATSADVTVPTDATTYFVVVRAVDASGHSDQNQKELSNTTLDGTPPVFAGVTSAGAHGTSITLTWAAATDNVTAAADIVYRVYSKSGSGSYDFTTPTVTTQPGVTSQTLIGLNISTLYDFVVRAVDGAGNEDTNTVEKGATTAASSDVTAPTFGGLTSATGTSATSIQLSWSAATDDTSPSSAIVYDVFVASTSGAESYATPSYTTAAGATSFVLTGLTPLQQVYAVVRARDQAGNEDTNILEHGAATLADTTPPTFGGAATATATGPASIQVTWNAATDDSTKASGITYQIFVATASGAEDFTKPTTTSAAGQTSVVLNGLAPNKQYWIVVRAADAYGNVDTNRTEVTATTQKDVTAPTFAGATSATTLGKTSINVSWTAATDDTTPSSQIVYQVCISKSATTCMTGFVASATTGAGATSFTASSLSPGTAYYFVVRARDASGNVDTNVVQKTATTTADTTAPTFGGATGVTNATTSSLTVTWAAATDDTTPAASIKYDICISTTSGACTGSGFTINAQVTGTTSRQYTALTVNTTYCFVVRAEDLSGNRDTNNVEQCGKTSADTTAPTFGGATGAAATSDTSINVSWSAASDNISSTSQLVYDVCWTTTNGGCSGASFTVDATSAAGATSLAIGSLTPSTSYFFVVRARDQAGNRDANSTQVSTATAADATAPSSPLSPSVDSATLTSLRVNWQAATDDATPQASLRYRVCVTETASCTTTSAGATSLTVTGLSQNALYHFQISAVDSANNLSAAPATTSGTTLADTTPPTWTSGPTLSVNYAAPTQLGVSWTAATDNYWSSSGICYDVCASALSSDCTGTNFALNAFSAGCGVTGTTLTGLATRTAYYVAVRARDSAGNVESGTHAALATTPTSYATDVAAQVFQVSYTVGGCQSGFCHGTSSGDWTRADIVNVTNTEGYSDAAACGGTLFRVNPGFPEQSYLFRKLFTLGTTSAPFSASCPVGYNGGMMPCSGPQLSGTQVSIIQDWITQGALDN